MVKLMGAKLSGALHLFGLWSSGQITERPVAGKIDDLIHNAPTIGHRPISTGAVSSTDSLRFRRYGRAARAGATRPRAGRRDLGEVLAGINVHRSGGSK